MRVEPELRDHPKFLRLKKMAGPEAMEFLMALWGHCQNKQRGEHWPGADSDYVEAICRWDGQPGELFKALCGCGAPGFIEKVNGGILIHDWNEMNATTVGNWRRNPFGRKPEKPTVTPTVTPPAMTSVAAVTPTVLTRSTDGSTENSITTVGLPHGIPHGNPNDHPVQHSYLSILTKPNYPNQTGIDQPPTEHPPENGHTFRFDLAQGRLALLNELTGAKFPENPATLHAIACRLQEVSQDVEGTDRMLRRQVAMWTGTDMAKNLRPRTLFDERYFAEYYGQRDLPVGPLAKSDAERLEQEIAQNPANPESVYHSKDASPEHRSALERATLTLKGLIKNVAQERAV